MHTIIIVTLIWLKLRRETIVRPTDSVVSPVERFEAPSLHDEDELDTPPFFKNR